MVDELMMSWMQSRKPEDSIQAEGKVTMLADTKCELTKDGQNVQTFLGGKLL